MSNSKSGSRNATVTSDFRQEVELLSFCACAVKNTLAHARNGHISISCVKSDVLIEFLQPNFLYDVETSDDTTTNKGISAVKIFDN